jgi:hypothetical protein
MMVVTLHNHSGVKSGLDSGGGGYHMCTASGAPFTRGEHASVQSGPASLKRGRRSEHREGKR